MMNQSCDLFQDPVSNKKQIKSSLISPAQPHLHIRSLINIQSPLRWVNYGKPPVPKIQFLHQNCKIQVCKIGFFNFDVDTIMNR